MKLITLSLLAALSVLLAGATLAAAADPVELATPALRLRLWPDSGRCELDDLRAGATWRSDAQPPRFGAATLRIAGKPREVDLGRCEVQRDGKAILATFRPVAEDPQLAIRIRIEPSEAGDALAFSYELSPAVERLRLLDRILAATAAGKGYALVPVRLGLMIPADSGIAFTQGFDTYAYEGCHMAMVGVVNAGAALLVDWTDPYVLAEVQSVIPDNDRARQRLSTSIVLRKSARSCTVRVLGKGGAVTVARAYRQVARERGWLVTWDQKLQGHPEREKLFGASNYKLWSVLSRRMNEDSTKEERVTLNWTFDQSAQIAEHLKNDLKLDRVFFLMGGWIHRGYDNQHPDILPSAPECGGDEQFAQASRRIRAAGYLLGLHDNYQDMYKDAPSWDESYLTKNPDGSIARGGHWAGGFAYLTCSKKAVELAKRPQNLPAVKKLTNADAYFIDTTYAAGLMECFDPNHPLTRLDDMKWKQAISDYGREQFGIFGSECGREWGIPHSDFFEGLTGVSGTYYHNKELPAKVGGIVVPLFEMVYRDCIAMYGKYGYDINAAGAYVAHHVSIGRPLHYHSIPKGLYWKDVPAAAAEQAMAIQPAVLDFKPAGPRAFEIRYRWTVERAPAEDWNIFIHFVDASGEIRFQGDYAPPVPASKWPAGTLDHGPFTVRIPAGLTGAYEIRAGLFQRSGGPRGRLRGLADDQRRIRIGRITVKGDEVAFAPIDPASAPAPDAADPALYVRGDGGWSEGMHPLDRFVKNTHEVLSPLNLMTSRMTMTACDFLTPDGQVRRTVFGEGPQAVRVVVNLGRTPYTLPTPTWGEVTLPAYGFLVDSPSYVAFCATKFNGTAYDRPALFTIRSLDGGDIRQSKVRIYHGFGPPILRLPNRDLQVPRELDTAN